MFDFDAGKFLIIGVVALVVIGPKELPRVLRQVGQAVSRMKRMAAEFQGQFMDAMKEADIESIREDIKKLGADAELSTHFDPARDIQRELTSALEAPKVAEAIPALAEGPGPAEGFALPRPDLSGEPDAGGLPGDTTPDPAGRFAAAAMPDVAEDPAAAASLEPAQITPAQISLVDAPILNGTGRPAVRKRKILMPKRHAVVGRVHVVSDRTAVPRGRLVLARTQDAADR